MLSVKSLEIGDKSNNGLLTVVDIFKENSIIKVKLVCSECSHDRELFPDGFFIMTKNNYINGRVPCGCSKSPKWSQEQQLIRATRAAEGRFLIHGIIDKYIGKSTRLDCECIHDGYRWKPILHNVVTSLFGCPKCARNARPTEQDSFEVCEKICEIENYKPIGFPDGYKNQNSRFEYLCHTHGKQNVSYSSFVNNDSRCPFCARDRQVELGNGNGYFSKRKDEQDYLYILDFDSQFIKVGRSFDVDRRIHKELKRESGIHNIIKLKIFTATHQEVYDTEQEILRELRERNFQHYVDWSKECFDNDCFYILNNLLDYYNLPQHK